VWTIDTNLAEIEAPESGQALQKFRNPSKEVPEVCRCKFTTFHQSFSCEDFVEGIKPQSEGGQISYEVRDGIFQKACQSLAALPVVGGGLVRKTAEGALQLGHPTAQALQDFARFGRHAHAVFTVMARGGIAFDGVFKLFAAGAAGAEALAGSWFFHTGFISNQL
jgi:hypothetical protein